MKQKNADCRGSALVEFSLLLGVLLPVGLGVAMLGKLTDLKQTSEQASRYSTWEATVYSRDALAAQQASTVQTRFFEAPDAKIVSNGEQSDDREQNLLWGHENVNLGTMRDLASVARDKDAVVDSEYHFDTGKAQAAALSGEAVALLGKPLSGVTGNSWGLTADGLLKSEVSVALQSSGFLAQMQGTCTGGSGNSGASTQSGSSDSGQESKKQVCVRSGGAILADGWAASSDEHAVSRIRSLVPSSFATPIGQLAGSLLGSTIFPELDPLKTAFGHVDMSVLPEYAE